VTDGERLQLAVKDLGSCDLYPQVMLPYTLLSLLILSKADISRKYEHILRCKMVWDAELEA
jgi:hypothetical protein